MGKIGEFFGSLSSMDKLLLGLGGMVTAGLGGALAVGLIMKGDRITAEDGFRKFQTGIAVTAIVWEIVESYINSSYGDKPEVQKGTRFIDNLLDRLKIIASSDDLKGIVSRGG
jgi:hypothetical protein